MFFLFLLFVFFSFKLRCSTKNYISYQLFNISKIITIEYQTMGQGPGKLLKIVKIKVMYTGSLWPISWIKLAHCCLYPSSFAWSIPSWTDGEFLIFSLVKYQRSELFAITRQNFKYVRKEKTIAKHAGYDGQKILVFVYLPPYGALNVHSQDSIGSDKISNNWQPFKNAEKCFYFVLKALLVLHKFKYLYLLFVHVQKRLGKKAKVHFKNSWLHNYSTYIIQYLKK